MYTEKKESPGRDSYHSRLQGESEKGRERNREKSNRMREDREIQIEE